MLRRKPTEGKESVLMVNKYILKPNYDVIADDNKPDRTSLLSTYERSDLTFDFNQIVN